MRKKRNSIKIITAGTIATLLALSGSATFAAQGGGGPVRMCNAEDFYRGKWSTLETATCEYAGAAFAYFVYDSTNAGNLDIRAGSGTGGEGGDRTIPSDCIQYGGFYHYGYTDIKTVTTIANGTTENVINGYGSIGNPGRVDALSSGRFYQDYNFCK